MKDFIAIGVTRGGDLTAHHCESNEYDECMKKAVDRLNPTMGTHRTAIYQLVAYVEPKEVIPDISEVANVTEWEWS